MVGKREKERKKTQSKDEFRTKKAHFTATGTLSRILITTIILRNMFEFILVRCFDHHSFLLALDLCI